MNGSIFNETDEACCVVLWREWGSGEEEGDYDVRLRAVLYDGESNRVGGVKVG